MAYTPYSQALPDTSRYTLDPVLQERLYQPVRPDPYQAGMLSTMANDYYADPFGYTNKRFGALDETLATDTPDVGLGGMFAPLLQNNSDGGNETTSLTPEQIAFFDNETPEARDARMGRINSMLSLVAQGLVPGLSTLSIAQMGPTAYADMMQGNARTVAGDPFGYTGQDSNMPSRQPGQPAPVVTGAEVQAAITEAKARNNYNSRFAPTDSGSSDGGGWSTGGSVTDSGTGDNPNEGGYWG
jgi:hypothetical protein